MLGNGATSHSRPFFSPSALICQMPFQLKAVLLFSKAMKSASWAILPGEWPFLTRSWNHVIALTPGSSAQSTCLASSENSVPPNC